MLQLKEGQVEAVEKIRNGNIICGDVGSGKSIVALWYYFETIGGGKMSRDNFKKISDSAPLLIIITTAKKRDNFEWEEELAHFGLSTKRNEAIVDSWNNIKKYSDKEKCFFIFDEQRVVGKGAWVKNFIKISKSNQWILLSATPGDNWVDYIPVFIANGFYRNKSAFEREHVIYDRFSKYPRIDKYLNERKLRRLRNRILVDVPVDKNKEYHYINIECSYDKPDYLELMSNKWNIFEDKPIENVSEMCYLLRKVTNSSIDRLNSLKEIYKEKHKIIVFYNYKFELELIRDMLDDEKINYTEWNGEKHENILHLDNWVYLVQYNAGAEGWNCISTDTIVFYSLNYSYKIMKQAAGRIDRLTSPYKDLYYYYLKSKSPIDILINRAIKRKKNFQESAFIKKSFITQSA